MKSSRQFVDISRRATLLTAGLLAAAALASPSASAEGGVPGDPFPVPTPGMSDSSGNGCQGGEVRVDGNCIPAVGGMSSGEESHTTDSFANPVDNMPSINGDPCSGAWESTVCYAEGNVAPVQPHSELSASP